MKRTAMNRGTGFKRKPAADRKPQMTAPTPPRRGIPQKGGVGLLARPKAPMRSRSKTNAKRKSGGEDKLCKGQPCYLRIPRCCTGQANDPCHSNQLRHGKGKGIKAHDEFTVPGCRACHNEIDQGKRFTKEEKFGIWDDAYARWAPVRDQLKGEK